MKDDKSPRSLEELADFGALVARRALAKEGACPQTLGIVSIEGVIFCEISSKLPQTKVRAQVKVLSEVESVTGFVMFAPTSIPLVRAETEEGMLVQIDATSDMKMTDGGIFTVCVVTRNQGRVLRGYETHRHDDEWTLSDEPAFESDAFATWVFDGIWEVMQ